MMEVREEAVLVGLIQCSGCCAACVYDGNLFQSAEQIPRPHPCDFCFCFRGDIICLHQTCPPPMRHCIEAHIDRFCCPRHECRKWLLPPPARLLTLPFSFPAAVQSMSRNPTIITPDARVARSTTSSPIGGAARPPPLYSISVIEKKGCRVSGRCYEVGQRIPRASNACLDCRCDHSGMMKCDPQVGSSHRP